MESTMKQITMSSSRPPGQDPSEKSVLLQRNPALRTFPFDSEDRQERVLCEFMAPDGGTARRFSVSARVIELLQHFDGRRSTKEAVAAYRQTHPRPQSDDVLERWVTDILLRNKFVLPVEESWAESTQNRRKRARYLQLQLRVLPRRVVAPIARVLSVGFTPWMVVPALLLMAAAHVAAYYVMLPRYSWNSSNIARDHGAAIIVLMVLSALAHEFGHASAASRYGCRRCEIGIGQYMHLTVLYTDLSDVWRLPRRQRAVVDVGGLYFQMLFASLLFALQPWLGWQVPLAVLMLCDAAAIATLNPFFRLDGYWLVSDLAGIANLRNQSSKFLRNAWSAIAARSWGWAEPSGWTLSRRATVALAIYSLLSCAFVLYMARVIILDAGPAVVSAYPGVLQHLWQVVTMRPLSIRDVGHAFMGALWRSVVLFGVGRFAYGILAGCTRVLSRMARRARTRHAAPRQESLAGSAQRDQLLSPSFTQEA